MTYGFLHVFFHKGDKEGRGACYVKNHNSDARVGIKAVFKLGMENRWNESAVYEAVKEASKGVEIEVIRGLRDRDLIILLTLINKKEKIWTLLYHGSADITF